VFIIAAGANILASLLAINRSQAVAQDSGRQSVGIGGVTYFNRSARPVGAGRFFVSENAFQPTVQSFPTDS